MTDVTPSDRNLAFGRGSKVAIRGSRVKSRESEKYEVTLTIIFSSVYTNSSRFLAMFNDVLTLSIHTYPYIRTQIYQIVTETKLLIR